jgi:NAD(P)-dependent dehydrogenase (short-subunit alcohol dehydrogenase family)
MKLKGKTALITGAAAGIGRAIAARFLAEGAQVACVDVNAALLESTVRALRTQDNTVLGIAADVSSQIDVERAMDTVLAEFGGLDILVNNAGIICAGTVESVTPTQWDRIIAVNLTSVYLLCRAAWPHFSRQKHGTIINMSSIMGLTGGRNSFAYSSTKAAIISLTRCLAEDGGPLGIRVNCVCPGYVQTPGLDDVHDAETQRRLAAQIPVRRMASPDEIAAGFAFLASDDSSYASGAALVLDGAATVGFAGCYLNM